MFTSQKRTLSKYLAYRYSLGMYHFFVKNYFDLADCQFRDLFLEEAPVWETLKNIAPWLKAQKLGKIEGEVSDKAFLVNPELITIGKGSVIEPGAYLKGPLWIGENTIVRHGAYLRGDVVIGSNVVIGHDTEAKSSIFLNGASAAHFAYVGNSILGNKVNLGAGVKLANLRLNHQEIKIEGEKTGLKKMGSILGDNASVGCNAVLNPGTLVGGGSDIHPLVNASGVIPPETKVSANLSFVLRQKNGKIGFP